jgi:hypothetical protein
VHDPVRDTQIPDHAVFDLLVRRLPEQIAAKQQPRPDASRLEMLDQLVPSDGAVFPDRDREAEPARIGIRSRLRKDEKIREVLKPLVKVLEVLAPAADEFRELCELRDADSRLHVGELQVVADM